MPPQPKVHDEDILKLLKGEQILDGNGNLKVERDDIWKKALDIFKDNGIKENDINRHNLYMRFKRPKSTLMQRFKMQLAATSSVNNNIDVSYDIDKEEQQNSETRGNIFKQLNNNDKRKCKNIVMEEKKRDSDNDLDQLLSMKYDMQYNSIIQQINGIWFQLMYWSPE